MSEVAFSSDPIDIATELLRRKSLTPDDAGCQDFIRGYLENLGFEITDMSRGDTTNIWAIKKFDEKGPTFLFAGHTDVVSPGNIEKWQVEGQAIEPFDLTEIDGRHYGRGIADMKGGLAAMLSATSTFLQSDAAKNAHGTFAYLITSDEEGPGIEGTKMAVNKLKDSGTKVDYCLIGEPSSKDKIGDRVYYGHRGSHTLEQLKISGLVGHVALGNGVNAAAIASLVVQKAYQTQWGSNDYPEFVQTVFEVTELVSSSRVYDNDKNEISSGENVTPDEAIVRANWRYNPSITPEEIEAKMNAIIEESYLEISVEKTVPEGALVQTWVHKGDVFQTQKSSKLLKATEASVNEILNITPQLSTAGGTSDGRFISPILGADVIELGMVDTTIHNPNENIKSDDLQKLTSVYEAILVKMLIN